jgi:serine/threonine-protein kinase RsbW
MTPEKQKYAEHITFSIPSQERHIYLADMVISYVVSEMGFDDETGDQISLAFIEAVGNAIKHGNKNDPEKAIELSLHVEQDKLTAFVRDCGSGFDLECVEDPLDPENLMKPCGRGIFLMRSLMDRVIYNIDEDCGTEVQLIKYRNSPDQQDAEDKAFGPKSLPDILSSLACA